MPLGLLKKKKSDRHTFTVGNTKFIVDRKYAPIKLVGTGAYGVVCAAVDKVTNSRVAIKKITNAFDDLIDAKRILREIKMLHFFNHDNIVNLVDLINPLSERDFEDVYVVMDFMETDLHRIIYSKNELTDEHCQYFLYQILRGMKFIHSASVIHRDLKPSNLLLNSDCELKICDFGLARGVHADETTEELTEYVVTRWYRAPEIMCAGAEYTSKVDVWAIGCIFGELLGRKPLFPGDNYIHQLNLIFGAIGTPSDEELDWVSNEKALKYIRSLEPKPRIPFREIYPHASEEALDLLDHMLQFDPRKRYSVEQALQHTYLAELHSAGDEPVSTEPFLFEFEETSKTKTDIQKHLFDEILAFRPDATNPIN